MTGLGPLILAQQDAAPPAQLVTPWWQVLLDNSLGIMLALIFLAAIIGAFVSQRQRDRCLKRFHHYSVTIAEQTGRAVWGMLKVFSNGVEIRFTEPGEPAADQPGKRSFLYYQTELAKLLTITRYLDEMTAGGELARRMRQLRKMARPGLPTRVGRKVRNFFSTFRDALVRSIGIAVAEVQKTSKHRALASGTGDITAIGTTIIGEVGYSYEPMLEQYFGRQVVAEIVNPADPDKRIVEIGGYLGEYSASHVLLVDCEATTRGVITVPEQGHRVLAQQLKAALDGRRITVRHLGTFAGRIVEVRFRETRQTADVPLVPGGEATVELAAEPPSVETVEITVEVTRRFDVILPRAIAAVRHQATLPSAKRS